MYLAILLQGMNFSEIQKFFGNQNYQWCLLSNIAMVQVSLLARFYSSFTFYYYLNIFEHEYISIIFFPFSMSFQFLPSSYQPNFKFFPKKNRQKSNIMTNQENKFK